MLKTMTREHGHIEVDVQEILLKLRKQRSGMVQTEVRAARLVSQLANRAAYITEMTPGRYLG
jgi:hypothetical protein